MIFPLIHMIFTWYPHYITINPPNIVTCRFLQRPGEPFIRERFTFASSFSTWPSEAFFLKHMFMTCSWKTMRWLILGFTCAIRRLTIFEASVGVWTLPSFVEHFYILTPGKKGHTSKILSAYQFSSFDKPLQWHGSGVSSFVNVLW